MGCAPPGEVRLSEDVVKPQLGYDCQMIRAHDADNRLFLPGN
jgi:hypothetical protein